MTTCGQLKFLQLGLALLAAGDERGARTLADGADVFLLHVEATDEAGHAGDLDEKVKALEAWDTRILDGLVEGLDALDRLGVGLRSGGMGTGIGPGALVVSQRAVERKLLSEAGGHICIGSA